MPKKIELIITDKSLKSCKVHLMCNELIRKIAGKREVYNGTFNNEPAIIKIFTSKLHGPFNFKNELSGFQNLLNAGISTAKVLASGKNDKGQYVLVLEKIQDAEDVFSLTQKENKTAANTAIEKTFLCLAKMHKNGVIQNDLHFGNFLWNSNEVFALDPAEMVFKNKTVSLTKRIDQLATLLASNMECCWNDRAKLLKHYFSSFSENLNASLITQIEAKVLQKRIKQIPKMLKKSLRTSKKYTKVISKNFSGVFTDSCFESINLSRFMQNIDEIINAGEILKRGNTCFVSKIEVGNKPYVVKRYNHKGTWHSLRHTLKRGRARKCWLFGHRLSHLNIPCAKPIAFIQHHKFGLLWQTYIINEFIQGSELSKIITDSKYTNEEKEKLVNESKELLNQLISFKMTHGDMKLGNIMIQESKPILIDLDSMKLHRDPITLKLYANKMLKYFDFRFETLQK